MDQYMMPQHVATHIGEPDVQDDMEIEVLDDNDALRAFEEQIVDERQRQANQMLNAHIDDESVGEKYQNMVFDINKQFQNEIKEFADELEELKAAQQDNIAEEATIQPKELLDEEEDLAARARPEAPRLPTFSPCL